ncbi:acyltransferase [Luteibacter aegosomaticola]|uniref:acyltransferase family protein n=1 Tax=Luteibacter aegosomaticola TaxID=2911538 RepID=UPI001FFB0133|nr:acyltransferase [Luteibacter aegosomaticola]UPG89637.1 acyltransferase [Luteibacter aegosomaticola]
MATSRLPGLDVLRAAAILAVLGTHAWVAGGMGPGFDWLDSYGWMGVDLFFVLSGYLIGRPFLAALARGDRPSLRDFYRQRAYRILPAYIVVLLLYFLIPGFREAPAIQPPWQFLTFTVNLLIEPGVQHAFSSVWSLCVEEHFYVVFPLLAIALAPIATGRRVLGLAIVVMLAGCAWRAYAWHAWALPPTPREPVWHMDPARYMQWVYYPSYARLDGLLCGVLLAAIHVYRPALWQRIQDRPHAVGLIGVALVGISVVMVADIFTFVASVPAFPLLAIGLACIVASATSPRSLLARAHIPGARWVAAISYSLYLIHKAMFKLVYTHLPESLLHRGLLTFLCSAVVAVLAGALLHYAVEKPFLKLREARRMAPRQSVEAAA